MVLKNKIVGVGLVGCVACLASAQPYRYYRFTVEATGGEPLQLSEVKLFSGAADVTRRAKQVLWNDQGFNPVFPTYKPQRAVDANLGTKWYDDRMVAADAEVRARTWFTNAVPPWWCVPRAAIINLRKSNDQKTDTETGCPDRQDGQDSGRAAL